MIGTSVLRRLTTAGLTAAALTLTTAAAAPPAAAAGPIVNEGAPGAVPGSYIVVLKNTKSVRDRGVPRTARDLSESHNGKLRRVYGSALRGFSVQLDQQQAKGLAANPDVAYVEQDRVVTIADTQTNPPSYGIDRIDQRALPLSNSYTFSTRATNVTAFIIDTGIRITHQDFGGRARVGTDTVGDGRNGIDCNGHGTHVSGTVGGSSFGVAKGVKLVAVRVLNCQGSGTNSGVIAGVDYVTQNATKPAVANMSLGGGASTALDNAVTNSINSGVTYAIAAGNSNNDACGGSPARVPAAITVAASDRNDARASFSSFGTCVDIFAPGVNITSAWMDSDTATNTISGTSMATPHVAGGAALILADNPNATAQQVRDTMVTNATTGVITNPGAGSPNRLLFTGGSGQPPPPALFSDDFEAARGWTANPNGSDTATTGQWERGDPQATTSGGTTLQRGDTTSGTNDLVTGASAGASVGANDIDGGVTSIQSAAITLPSGNPTLSFSWYLGHLNNASSADFLRVSVVAGGTTTQVFQQVGAASTRAAAWQTATASLSPFAGQSVRILVQAADAAGASLVEAGVDDVRITN